MYSKDHVYILIAERIVMLGRNPVIIQSFCLSVELLAQLGHFPAHLQTREGNYPPEIFKSFLIIYLFSCFSYYDQEQNHG